MKEINEFGEIVSNFKDKDDRLICDLDAIHRNEKTGEIEDPTVEVNEVIDSSDNLFQK